MDALSAIERDAVIRHADALRREHQRLTRLAESARSAAFEYERDNDVPHPCHLCGQRACNH